MFFVLSVDQSVQQQVFKKLYMINEIEGIKNSFIWALEWKLNSLIKGDLKVWWVAFRQEATLLPKFEFILTLAAIGWRADICEGWGKEVDNQMASNERLSSLFF